MPSHGWDVHVIARMGCACCPLLSIVVPWLQVVPAHGQQQEQPDATGTTCHIALTLQTLPTHHQLALAQLSIFPAAFDEEGAAAVLGCSCQHATSLLHVLHQHNLVLHGSASGQHYVHMAAREVGRATLDETAAASQQERYIAYVLQLLDGWAVLYTTKDAPLALSQARAHTADLRSAGVGGGGHESDLWLLSPGL